MAAFAQIPLEKLQALKDAVADIDHPFKTEAALVAFLRAKGNDVAIASKAFREAIEWRHTYGADTLLRDFVPPKVYLDYFPGGNHRYCKDGTPLFVGRDGKIDVAGLLQSLSRDVVLKCHVYSLEVSWAKFLDECSKQEKIIDGITYIVDLEGLGMKDVSSEATALKGEMSRIEETYYP
jgi:hypothetical protein